MDISLGFVFLCLFLSLRSVSRRERKKKDYEQKLLKTSQVSREYFMYINHVIVMYC